ncbi:MAG: hypothetical protein AAF065_07980 [Verrucomicrobiota bacterium]
MKKSLPIVLFTTASLISGCYTTGKAKAPASPVASKSATYPIPSVAPESVLANIDQAYADALDDASNPTPKEIVDTLNSISKTNEDLLWKTFSGQDYVLVETWISASDVQYYQNGPDGFYNNGTHLIWVSPCPYLQDLCSKPGFGGDDLDMRLRQLIGLPPNDDKSYFVELWVRPADLFRPSPDAEVDDSQAELDFPGDVTPEHRKWMNTTRAHQYYICGDTDSPGWPWTQLGYTYDWGNPPYHVGMSEYIIKADSKLVIERIVSTADYCDK